MTRGRSSRPAIVVAGVSGSGKSTVGAALARELNVPYRDGDDLHPAQNIARMAAGIPLDDADRWPWLDRIGEWLRDAAQSGRGGVVSCSALKRSYRDRLRRFCPGARIVLCDPPASALRARVASRPGHFMPSSLLDSQLATFEPPDRDERVIVVDTTNELADVIGHIRDVLADRQPPQSFQ